MVLNLEKVAACGDHAAAKLKVLIESLGGIKVKNAVYLGSDYKSCGDPLIKSGVRVLVVYTRHALTVTNSLCIRKQEL